MKTCDRCGFVFTSATAFRLVHSRRGYCVHPSKVGLHETGTGAWRLPRRSADELDLHNI